MTSKKERLNKYMLEVVGDTTFFEQNTLKKQWQELQANRKEIAKDIRLIIKSRERVNVAINKYLKALAKIEELETLQQAVDDREMSPELKELLEYFGTESDLEKQSEIMLECQSWCKEQKQLVLEKLVQLLRYSQKLRTLESSWEESHRVVTADVELIRQRISPYLLTTKLLDAWTSKIVSPLADFNSNGKVTFKQAAVAYGITMVPATLIKHFVYHQAWLASLEQALWMPVAWLVSAVLAFAVIVAIAWPVTRVLALMTWFVFEFLVVKPTARLLRGYSLKEAEFKHEANWQIGQFEKRLQLDEKSSNEE